MQKIKILGYLGLLGSVIVGVGEHLLHYSPFVLDTGANYQFFEFVSLFNLKVGHFLAVIGTPFYFLGYLHIYYMLVSGDKKMAITVLMLGFIAFSIGGVWIGSRAFLGNIIHLQQELTVIAFSKIIDSYNTHIEILVQVLRVVIFLISIVFVTAILRGNTLYDRKMAWFNPINILLLFVIIGSLNPSIGKYILPILMNLTHFVFFAASLILSKKQERTKTIF